MLLTRKLLLALCLVLASFTQLRADQKTENIRLYPLDSHELTAPIFWEEDALLRVPEPTPLVDLLSDRPYATGERVFEYGGLQGAIINRILSYHHRYYFAALDAAFNHGYMSLGDVDRISMEYMWGQYDAKYGRWWDRNFFESMVPERGGAERPEVCYIGREEPIFEIGEIAFTNTGKLNLGGTEVYINKAIVDTGSVKSVVSGIVRREKFKISNYVNVCFKPRINIRTSLKPENVLSSIELAVDVDIYYNPARPPIFHISIVGNVEPFKDCATLKLNLFALVW
jgi:hypothetical protein